MNLATQQTLKKDIVCVRNVGNLELALVRYVESDCVCTAWHIMQGVFPGDRRKKAIKTTPLDDCIREWNNAASVEGIADMTDSARVNGVDTFMETCGHAKASELSAMTSMTYEGKNLGTVTTANTIMEAIIAYWSLCTLESIIDAPEEYDFAKKITTREIRQAELDRMFA